MEQWGKAAKSRAWQLEEALVLAAVYFGCGAFGLSLALVNKSASAVWPPSGIALAALLLGGIRLWPGVFAGAFLVNILTQGSVATSLAIATGNTLEAFIGAKLVFRFANGALAFDRFVPPYEATLVKHLRDAGAIIIAKTGMTELANWVAGEAPSSGM